MLSTLFAFVGVSYLISGVSCLSCSFDDGLCGWRHPENATKTLILAKGISQHIQTLPTVYPEQEMDVRLVYPNFTGSGFLTFSLSLFESSSMYLQVGEKTVFSMKRCSCDKAIVWEWFTTPINASQESVVLRALTASGKLAIDDFIFNKTKATRCSKHSVPDSLSMNCTASNLVDSVCFFKCKEGSHVMGSRQRCLPTGMWSGIKPSCEKPKLRLKAPTSNSSETKGHIEIFVNKKWSPIAIKPDSAKYSLVAVALCRSLGLHGQAKIRESYSHLVWVDSWLVLGKCNANAQSIADCKRSDIARHLVKPYAVPIVICGNSTCPVHCHCDDQQQRLYGKIEPSVSCSPPANSKVLKEMPTETMTILLDNISINNLKRSSFDHLADLWKITMSNAKIRRLPKDIFAKHKWLRYVNLNGNLMTSVADIEPGAIPLTCYYYQLFLYVADNHVTNITKESTKGLKCVTCLYLPRNKIHFIEYGSFIDLQLLSIIDLSDNVISKFEPNTFPTQLTDFTCSSNRLTGVKREYFNYTKRIRNLILMNNSISFIEEGSFNSGELDIIDLRFNKITNIPPLAFQKSVVRIVYLSSNKIEHIPDNLFKGKKTLHLLDISKNPLTKMTKKMLENTSQLMFLAVMNAGVMEIEDMAFQNAAWMGYVFLDDNRLARITKWTFYGARKMMYLTLSGNPLSVVEEGAFSKMRDLKAIYLIGTSLHIIDIGKKATFVSRQLQIAHSTGKNLPGVDTVHIGRPLLRSSGYWCQGSGTSGFKFCFPCDQGEYKLHVFNEYGCQKCPPGGFYQDKIAHVGEVVHGVGCKQCPEGSYVSPENAPGRTEAYCSACPEGTNLQRLAGFRACPCLDNYYRLDRFGSCIQCPLGYKCTNETVNLHPGFFWIWNNDNSREGYLTFSDKLQIENKDHEFSCRIFNETLPFAYLCPFTGSCEGGFDAKCADGYEGTLCAVCSKGFYKMYSGCNKCPSLYLFVGQCIAVFIGIAVILLAIIKEKRSKTSKVRSVTDTIFSSLKIIIGFYQVTSGTLRAYSYIQWPSALTKLMKFADVVQLNIFKLVPIECVRYSIKMTPYVGLVTYVSLDVLVILLAVGYFYAKKVFLKIRMMSQHDQDKKLTECKANCYRAVFLFLFITYPATCEKVFQVLPAGCAKVCDNHQVCKWYLRSDYSTQCYTSEYNKFVILAYFALVIPLVFPVVTVLLLWKYCRDKPVKENAMRISLFKRKREDQTNEDAFKIDTCEIKMGMRFIYENYSSDCWYWEVIELLRKVILTSVLVYSGQHGRLFLGISSIMSGFYAVFFAYSKPIPHLFEHWLHLGSLMATVANQLMGMLLRIPAETLSVTVSQEDDDIGISVLLMFANVFLIVMIIVRYLYGVVLSLRRFKDNPECSTDCVLTVLQVMSTSNGQQRFASEKSLKHDFHDHVNKNK